MAKPIPAPPGDRAGSSSSTHHPAPSALTPATATTTTTTVARPRRRGTRQRTSPSSALLSLLATISTFFLPVGASPAPPAFLCPSLSQNIQRRATSPSPPASGRPKTRQTSKSPRSRTLPYKFDLGDDGVWHKVESYTLYGSTVCSKSCREPTNAVTSGDNNSMTSPTTSGSTTGNIDLQDTLPAGWKSKHDRSESRTTLILALSLVLAFFICFFIIGCLFWRKNLRRKHKDDDVETRTRRRSSAIPPSSQPVLSVEKEAKAKQKIWVRATARWKANARYTARHRRGKRPASIRSQPLESTTTLNRLIVLDSPEDEELAPSSTPRTPSRNISRQSSCTSLHEVHPSIPSQKDQEQQTDEQQLAPIPTLNSAPDTPTSPPAYRQRTLAASIATPSGSLSTPDHDHTGSVLRVPSPHPSKLSLGPPSVQTKCSSQYQESDNPPLPVHAAHVATDDKALLARLADLAERPPGEVLAHAESSHQLSAPVWEDEQPEDFARELGTSGSTSQSPFPPPPTKGKMVEPLFYSYPYTFEEFSESIELELEPSAPPFEAHGTPVADDLVMLPSAPPLPDEGYPEDSQLDVATDSDAVEHHTRGDFNGCPVEHCTTSSRRPLSEGTLPDYQP